MIIEPGTTKRFTPKGLLRLLAAVSLISLQACASARLDVYRDSSMDFGAVKTVAVLPFNNFTNSQQGGDRVRDVFTIALLATNAIYVLPAGEVARGLSTAGVANPTAPSTDEAVKLCKFLKADGLFTASLREYGEVRAGTATADLISMSMQLIEGQTGRIVWSASTTKGGVTVPDRLFGGGGRPLNDVTEKAVHEIINKLFE
jgi:polysaccharide biosynthesis protein PelC